MIPEDSIICGAMPKATKVFPNGYFNCSISSPPYWGLRDYGLPPSIWDGDKNCEHKWGNEIIRRDRGAAAGATAQTGNQKREIMGVETKQGQFCFLCGAWRGSLGLEPTFELYIKHLCTIYDEVKRVLRDDGCCFVNLGDTYWGGKGQSGQGSPEYQEARQDVSINKPASHVGGQKLTRPQNMQHDTIQAKSLCLIPQRFAIEMVNRGWILRNCIIWHKPNPMPSSAKDRFTVDFEYVYFFVKSKKYWFEPQYEPHAKSSLKRGYPKGGQGHQYKKDNQSMMSAFNKMLLEKGKRPNPLGANKRTVWTIPTQPYPEAHFATFPEKLVEPMIKAGCPEFVCTKCGKAREKIYETDKSKPTYRTWLATQNNKGKLKGLRADGLGQGILQRYYNEVHGGNVPPKIPKGYTDCGCKDREWRPGIVLDCFCRKLYHWQSRCKVA